MTQEAPSIDPIVQKNGIILAQAQLLESDDNADQAMNLYKDVLQSDPANPRALHRLAVLYARQGELDLAQQAFVDALAAGPDDAEIHNDFGYFCYLQRRWDLAEQHLLQATERDSSIRQAHINLGLLHARKGQLTQAERHFRNAGCTFSEAQNNVAFARLLEADYADARAAYQLAIREDSNNDDAVKGIEILDRLTEVQSRR